MSVDERMDGLTNTAVVVAAQGGDERALDELIVQYLPLVYNIVGRALGGHADVDDVVQETMLRLVHGIDGLRDPARFRSWLVSIAFRQVNERWRARQTGPAPFSALSAVGEVADPGVDFVDLTIARLGLSGERRQVAEATAWLDSEDRRLLSLWWLEAAGELTRADLAAALRLSQPHAAVRVQRMKAQLDTARVVVRALSLRPRCPDLAKTVEGWDGQPGMLWRKQIARHARHCKKCGTAAAQLVSAEALLAGLGLVPPPAVASALTHLTVTLGGLPAAAAAGAGHGSGWLAHAVKFAATKPAAVITAGVVAISGVTVLYGVNPAPRPDTRVTLPTPLVSPSASPSAPASSSKPVPTNTASPVQSQVREPLAYGSMVDGIDVAPVKLHKPNALPVRPAGTPITAVGAYDSTTGNPTEYTMNHHGNYLTLKGRGYFSVRWQIIYATGRVGVVSMPSWTGLTGRLFHVASGGSRRMDDQVPGKSAGTTWMGSPSTGFDTLPTGTRQMWQNEYYYLDGTVTLHQNQGRAENNLIVSATTWQDITTDVDTAPTGANGLVRYGIVRDTGDDSAPVPQYLTRGNPSDPSAVSQHSNVS